ncbi:MAG: hypothetical protein ACI86H_002058 [bacterium]|jgi:hypothetical protein
MNSDQNQPKLFSKNWVLASILIFIVCEVILGEILGKHVFGSFISRSLRYRVEVLLIFSSYFVGGFITGFISPTVRILEPAIGAFFSVALTFIYSLFIPLSFFRFSLSRILIAGGIAFVLAYFGAKYGEKIAGKLGNKESKKHFIE